MLQPSIAEKVPNFNVKLKPATAAGFPSICIYVKLQEKVVQNIRKSQNTYIPH